MSTQLLDGLGLPEQLLLQFAARQEHVPIPIVDNAPLDGDPERASTALQERGLLEAGDVPGLLGLTPMGYALRDEVVGRWPAFHARARARLVSHLCTMFGLVAGDPLRQAVERVDRALFVPEPARCLADLDIPLPTGVGRMTTSAPHAILGILSAVLPLPGERVLVCGAKGGVTMALCADLVGPTGEVLGLDWEAETVALVSASLATVPELARRTRVALQRDVTLGPPESEAPFQVLVMNGSVPKIPWPLIDCLDRDTGRLLFFLQEPNEPGQTCLVLHASGALQRDETLSRFVFTPIMGRYGWDSLDELRSRLADEE